MSPIQPQKIGFRILEILFGAFLVLGSVFIAKDFESALFPVVKEFEISSVVSNGDDIELSGHLTKNRQCFFRDLNIYVRSEKNLYPISVEYEFNDPNESLKTRSSIPQKWGPWVISIPYDEYKTAEVSIYSQHTCHSFYDTFTHIKTFNIQKNQDDLIIIK